MGPGRGAGDFASANSMTIKHLTKRWSESGSCRIAHLVDELARLVQPAVLRSMSRLASPFHSR
jgi:hypothetical protein